MESYLPLLISLALGIFLIRLILKPIRLAAKLGLHAFFGFLCLWIFNATSGITGLHLPINAVTSLIAGLLGLPGMGLIALLEIL